MHVALVAVAFALQSGRGVAPPPRVMAGQDPVKARVMTAERKFFDSWFAAWQGSERDRAMQLRQASVQLDPKGYRTPGVYNPRQADLMCYFDWDAALTYVPDNAWGIDPMKRAIGSKKNNRHWVCPNWHPPDDFYLPQPKLPDERLGIDAALEPNRRQALHDSRLSVIAEFEAAVRRSPRDNFYVGQLVRLLVDNQMLTEALTAVNRCAADAWWCAALAGYVYHRRGELKKAGDSFALSTRLRLTADRCKWTDIGSLLDGTAHWNYSQMNCAERDTIGDLVWWLADPLWSAPGNDRRNEQFAREVTIALHVAMQKDERYNWTPEGGGDAIAEMVRRYGWPTYTYAGPNPPRLRFPPAPPPTWGVNLLYVPKPKGPPIRTPDMDARALGGVKTTYEYSIGRLHMMPAWGMIVDPFGVKRGDWTVRANGGELDYTFKWWPKEHYAAIHPLSDINDDQHAFLRRQDSTLIAFATNLSQVELARRVTDSVTVDLLVSTGPNDISLIGEQRVMAIDRVTFLSRVPPGQSLISAEVPWDAEGHYGARARFAITAPKPLSAMERGAIAISDPVLLVVPPDSPALPNFADSAMAMMRGSTTLSTGTAALGAYWETYGYTARDSVEIAITIQRTSALNILRNLGVIAGVAGNPNAPVSMSWKEPQARHDTRTVSGAVPIQMRSVILNIAALSPGEYTLAISVNKPGKDGVKSARDFVLR